MSKRFESRKGGRPFLRVWRMMALRLGFGCAATALAVALLSTGAFAQSDKEDLPYRNTALSPETRAADLVSRMTLEEKAAQLTNDAPAIPRLGVREYNWWNEGLHGVAGAGYATVFPQAIGMAAAFDAPMLHDIADIISIEFRAKRLEALHRLGGSDWFAGLTVWSPNINIFRDPRWGRGQETYGEDPYLTAQLGVAFVKGLQGDDPHYLRTVATPKHFAVHSGPEATRHEDDIHPSAYDLEDTYLPAFRAAVMEGRPGSVMCAYNAVNGEPACANGDLLDTRLRGNWGFEGYIVSDCDAVGNMYRPHQHGFTETPEEGVAVAFNAGMDLICGGPEETGHILGAVSKGFLAEETIDRSLVRLFTARMRIGEFDPQANVFPMITPRDNDTEAHRAAALSAAEKSMVLLKNGNGLLPLRNAPESIAVIGPNADTVMSLVGNYNGEPSAPVTVLDGIRRRFPAARVSYAEGTGLINPVMQPVPDDAVCVDSRCRRRGLMTEHYENAKLAGKPVARDEEANARMFWEGESRNGSARWTGYIKAPESGEYRFRYDANAGYRIWIDGKQIIDAWNVDWRPSIATGAVMLEAGKIYPIRVEAFQRRDEGDERLVWSLPSDPGARDALTAAEKADLVIFVAGLTSEVEGEEMPVDSPGFSGGDRTTLDLPAPQQRLLERVAAVGKPVVLVLINGSPLSVNWADENIPAIIEAWYPGGQGGDAVARLIAGDYSPAGRLPMTFYRSADQLPPFNDYTMAGRTYRYFEGEPLYPFGYGLSYTSFAYANLRISQKQVRAGGTVAISVDVKNTGAMDGDEVVQLYVSHPGADGDPIRALAGFKRIHLARGETKTVKFTLDDRKLSTVDENGVRRVAPGNVGLWIGGGQPGSREGLSPAPGASAQIRVVTSATLAD